ncbi:preprotein translocase subunit SecE [Nocardioides sp. CCNWLW239]|uniref:preprotein translocase subunit SecE n=1 Tax=Nocardioides sp. CCNWLW239 TaxID=3128902 RepID=UPI0030198339
MEAFSREGGGVTDSKAAVPTPNEKKSEKRTSIPTFYRQVVAELRKVVWPTQQQLTTYFIVVLVFVLVMMAITAGLDLAFGKLMFWVFGGRDA